MKETNFLIQCFDVVLFMKQKQRNKAKKERDKNKGTKESQKERKEGRKIEKNKRETEKEQVSKGGGQTRLRRNKGRH